MDMKAKPFWISAFFRLSLISCDLLEGIIKMIFLSNKRTRVIGAHVAAVDFDCTEVPQ